MKFRFDTATKIVPLVLVVIGLLLALLIPWQCAKSQTAGRADTLALSLDYTAQTDVVMTEAYGNGWKGLIREDWRNSYRNWLSQGREQYRARRARVYDESLDPYLTAPERRKRDELYDSALVREQRAIEAKRKADSIAATQQTGALDAPAVTEQYAANIGKALSPRMLFLQDVTAPGTEGGGGGQPPPLAHGYIDGKGLATVVAVLVVGAVAVIAAGYGLYHLGKWALTR